MITLLHTNSYSESNWTLMWHDSGGWLLEKRGGNMSRCNRRPAYGHTLLLLLMTQTKICSGCTNLQKPLTHSVTHSSLFLCFRSKAQLRTASLKNTEHVKEWGTIQCCSIETRVEKYCDLLLERLSPRWDMFMQASLSGSPVKGGKANLKVKSLQKASPDTGHSQHF